MKYKLKFDGVTKTYAVLHHTASHLLKTAQTVEEGSLLTLQGAAVFYAFTFEAYLNHVGYEEIEIWDEIDRISHSKKLRIIAKHLELKIDHSQAPFQAISELFALRNILAHGRTTAIDFECVRAEEPKLLSSDWNIHEWELLTTATVEKYSEAVRKAIEVINASRKRPDEMLWNQGVKGCVVEPRENNTERNIPPH